MKDKDRQKGAPTEAKVSSVWLCCWATLILVGLGICFITQFSAPAWLIKVDPHIVATRWPRLIGIFLITVGFGNTVILLGMHWLRSRYDVTIGHWEATAYLGMMESVLYPASWLAAKPEFIPIWLALKATAGTRLWPENRAGKGSSFQVFLIGNGLSIISGTVAYGFMRAFVLAP